MFLFLALILLLSKTLKEISPNSITIAIFSALTYEAVAVECMLDEEYECCPKALGPIKYVYSFGRIEKHKVVIAQPHQMGTVAAAHCATAVSQQFPNVRFALMVGIGAGIPNPPKHDIRLGDIAVSSPQDAHAGVMQYDFGKYELDGFVLKGCLNKPPPILTSADKWLEREELKGRNPLREALGRITRDPKFSRPNTADVLFDDKFHHLNNGSDCGACEAAEEKLVVSRTPRPDKQPIIHRGLILSGNGVVKNPRDRDHLRRYADAICYEMEAAGIMDEIPCLIVRGVCDYADTHKQDGWHYYAAAVAAAYCRTLLCKIDSQGVEETESRVLIQTTKNIQQTLHLEKLKIAQGSEFDSYGMQHEECLPGTRVELLDQIEKWAGSPHGRGIFWLNGMAGTGKSTISKTISRRFREQRALGASFFFKRGEEERGNAKRLFPTLVKQLAANTLADDANISERVLREQFERLLLRPLLEIKGTLSKTMVVVIDALDECDQEDDINLILRLLPRVQASTAVKLRFFLTSRPDLPINLGFREITNDYQDLILHQIPLPVIEYDISQYFQSKLAQLRESRALPPSWPGNKRMNLLIEQAVPLFISATTMYRFISDKKWDPEKRLQAILAGHITYVSKMGSTYMTVLNQLLTGQDKWESQQLVQEFKEIVGVIILLATPLSAVALSRLVDLDLDDIDRRLNPLHSVLHIPRNSSTPVRLLHLSFRDFLLDTKTKEIKESKKFWIDAKAVHASLADKCLQIMKHSLRKNICNLPSDGILRSEIDKGCVDYCLPPELQYACRYWTEHLVQSQDPTSALVKAFLVLKVHLLHWLEAMSILGLISEAVGRITRLQPIIQYRAVKIPKYRNFIMMQRDLS
ncbi:purine and uridine phosphorylase [Aspergillus granulosus]|uniref:Purine and uridine phosphorylase n=1 Tax=Aspergillus granulosus TaxID=176169 RepID=A0ABR4HH10_9EURO